MSLRKGPRTKLSEIEVASPCPTDWNAMQGDEKVRFCSQCNLYVYNLSAMDAEEAADTIAQHDGSLCVRFYRKPDGTILTRDCPVGLEISRQKRRAAVERIALTVVGASLAGMLLMPTQGAIARPAAVTTALLSAAKANDIEQLSQFLDNGVDPNRATKAGQTSLMLAAECGHQEAVRLILKRGANVHQRNARGETALSLASQAGHSEVVEALEKAGAVQ
jgi:hypothetical protein